MLGEYKGLLWNRSSRTERPPSPCGHSSWDIPGQLGGDASDVGELTWKKSFEFMKSCLFPERIYNGGREELPASSHPPGPRDSACRSRSECCRQPVKVTSQAERGCSCCDDPLTTARSLVLTV